MPIAMPALVLAPAAERRRTAGRVFRGAVFFNSALTLYWLYTLASGRASIFFRNYKVDKEALGPGSSSGVLFLYVIWGLIWWGIKSLPCVGRLPQGRAARGLLVANEGPYEVSALAARYSERRIRIADMVAAEAASYLAFAGFYYLYSEVMPTSRPISRSASCGTPSSTGWWRSWIFLGIYYVNGFLGATFYGAQSRVMDGDLGRANCLLITTLWSASSSSWYRSA